VPTTANQRKAVDILRDRNHPAKYLFSDKQIQWAVEIVRQWEPNHPLLRYGERVNPVLKPSNQSQS
jgi:hypothetical protein